MIKRKRQTRFQRAGVICQAALLAANAVFQPSGARLRDVSFFVTLFSNWLEHAVGEDLGEVRGMQLSRFLNELRDAGSVRETRRGKIPRYSLTRAGVVDVLRSMLDEPLYRRPNVLLFVRHFLGSYREIILGMASTEASYFPPGLRLEIESLLDVSAFVRHQRGLAEREQKKLRLRADSSIEMGRLAARRLREGNSPASVVEELEGKHPYELNSQKPLTELYASMPPGHATWELTEGALARASDLWAPMGELWRGALDVIERLESGSDKKR